MKLLFALTSLNLTHCYSLDPVIYSLKSILTSVIYWEDKSFNSVHEYRICNFSNSRAKQENSKRAASSLQFLEFQARETNLTDYSGVQANKLLHCYCNSLNPATTLDNSVWNCINSL